MQRGRRGRGVAGFSRRPGRVESARGRWRWPPRVREQAGTDGRLRPQPRGTLRSLCACWSRHASRSGGLLRSPTAQAASRPWASRPLPSEPCSVSSPLAHCPGVGVCLGQAPPLLLSPSRHRGGRPSLIHPSLQLCVRKHSGPSRSWPSRQGSGAPVPCPPPSLHSRSGQGARCSRLGAEGVQRGQEATEGRWLR